MKSQRRTLCTAIVAVCCAAFLSPVAQADDTATTQLLSVDPPKYSTAFNKPFADKERCTFELLGTGIGDVSNRHVAFGGATVGVGYYFWDTIAVTLDVSGYGFSEGHTDGAATGVTLGLRHHLFSVGQSSVFVDCSGGEIEASNNLPRGGTHLNNTIEVGLGIAHPLSQDIYLLTGVRFFHLSNADSEGPNRNPAMNGIQGVLGVMWKF